MNVQRRRNTERQIPGCLGRMVNLFDFGTVVTGKNLLTQKPHFDNGSIKRNQINQTEDNIDMTNGAIGVNVTSMKKLLEDEMSKENDFKLGSSTNLIAKLMGIDSFPQPIAQKSNNSSSKSRLKRSLSQPGEGLTKKIVREKFLEAKRLVTNDKLRHSKEFQEAMEVLSSNKELFLEFLQESNSFFSYHLRSCSEEKSSKKITILKPSKLGNEWPNEEEEEYPMKQSTRIVVLKPNVKASSCPTSPRRVLKEESMHSSVFSNGYIGDDDDNRSENGYSDSEIIMSPVSRHSWDYINTFSSSPFSKASDSPESSSVCREAKKRLSERWALMAVSSNETNVIEKKRSNSTLGDMLALSDLNNELLDEEEEASYSNEQNDPSSLTRSISLPESSSLRRESKLPEELTKSKSLKWSLKGKVSNFLFSRNKKAIKERVNEETEVVNRCNDEFDASRCSLEGKPATFGTSREWLDNPSPISVLDTSFDDKDGMFLGSSIFNRTEPEMMSMRSNLLGKSPPIGSIGRSFSFDDSKVARCYSSKRSTTSIRDEEEDLRLLINTLLSAAELDQDLCSSSMSKWHSTESPLDPSLRNIYAEHRLGSKLVFDFVNALLLELTPRNLSSKKTLRDYLMDRMKESLMGNGRVEDRWWDEDGDLSSLAVNKVVRIEVAEESSSPENLRLEMDSMGEELELKLLEELVEETLMDLSRIRVFNSSDC